VSNLSPSSSSPTTTSSVVLVVVNGDKGGNGGCCRVPTCLASINQWEWHFGEVLGGGDGGGGGLCALRGCQQKWLPSRGLKAREEAGERKEKRWRQGGHFWWIVPTNGASRLPGCSLSLSLFLSVSLSLSLSVSLSISSLLYLSLFLLVIHSQVVKPPRHGEAKKPWRELSSRSFASANRPNSEIGLARGVDGKL